MPSLKIPQKAIRAATVSPAGVILPLASVIVTLMAFALSVSLVLPPHATRPPSPKLPRPRMAATVATTFLDLGSMAPMTPQC